MKKLLTVLAIALFTIGAQAQETKPAQKQKNTTATCGVKKTDSSEKMTATDIEKCKTKCKSEGKTCDVTATRKEKKACAAKS